MNYAKSTHITAPVQLSSGKEVLPVPGRTVATYSGYAANQAELVVQLRNLSKEEKHFRFIVIEVDVNGKPLATPDATTMKALTVNTQSDFPSPYESLTGDFKPH